MANGYRGGNTFKPVVAMRLLTSLLTFIACCLPLLVLWMLPVLVLFGPHGYEIAGWQLLGLQLLALLPALLAARVVWRWQGRRQRKAGQ